MKQIQVTVASELALPVKSGRALCAIDVSEEKRTEQKQLEGFFLRKKNISRLFETAQEEFLNDGERGTTWCAVEAALKQTGAAAQTGRHGNGNYALQPPWVNGVIVPQRQHKGHRPACDPS